MKGKPPPSNEKEQRTLISKKYIVYDLLYKQSMTWVSSIFS